MVELIQMVQDFIVCTGPFAVVLEMAMRWSEGVLSHKEK